MNRQLSEREIRLVMLLPAVLVVAIYACAFDQPHRAQVNALRQAAAQAGDHLTSQGQIQRAKADITMLQIDREKHRAAAATQLTLPTRWTSPAGRLNALADINAVFDAHSVFVVSTAHLPDTAMHGVAPQSLQDFAAAVGRQLHAQVPQVWQIEVVGSYADVLKALGELGRGDAFIVPLGLSMEPIGAETNYRHWSLWVWV
jgi:hypothetical protein